MYRYTPPPPPQTAQHLRTRSSSHLARLAQPSVVRTPYRTVPHTPTRSGTNSGLAFWRWRCSGLEPCHQLRLLPTIPRPSVPPSASHVRFFFGLVDGYGYRRLERVPVPLSMVRGGEESGAQGRWVGVLVLVLAWTAKGGMRRN